MSTTSRVTRNFLALASGETLSRIVAFGVTIYLARILGPKSYGVIAFAAGITLYLTKIADFAIEVIGTKEIADAPGSVIQISSAVMTLRLILGILLTGFSVLGVQLFLDEPERTILSLYFITLIPIAANTKWIHLGLENAKPIGLSRIVSEVLGLSIVVIFIKNRNDLWFAPAAQIANEFCFSFLLIRALRKGNYTFGLKWNLDTAIPIFRRAFPLLAHFMLALIIYNSDLIFLHLFRNSETVGYYAAAYTLISFLANIGFAYGLSLLPTLTRLGANTDKERSLYQTSLVHVYIVCIPISIGGCLLASQIITFGFGAGYVNSIVSLKLLIWCIPVSLFRIVPWAALVARGHQKLLLKAMCYAAVTNIVLNFLWVPYFGIIGAAVATVITECVLGILLFRYATHNSLPFTPYKKFLNPTIASLFMTVILIILKPSALLAAIFLGIASYGLVFFTAEKLCISK